MTVSDWTDITRNMKIDYDLEAHPLRIKTDSVVGSDEQVYVLLYKADDSYIGFITLTLSNPPQYYIASCTYSTPSPVTPPAEQDKIWTITKTASAWKVECNGVEVLNFLFSESTRSICVTTWSQDVGKITFYSQDTASDGYLPQPGIHYYITSL